MSAIDRAIRRVRARLFVQGLLDAGGWCLFAATVGCLSLLMAQRLLALPIHIGVYSAILALGLIAAPLWAFFKLPGRLDAAGRLDRALGFKDRIGTALYLRNHAQPLARVVLEQAEDAARSARASRAAPLSLSRTWGYLPVAAAALGLSVWLLPEADLAGWQRAREQQQGEQAQSEAAKKKLADSVKTIREIQQDEDKQTQPMDEQMLSELAELSQQDLRSPESRRTAAAKLSAIEEKVGQAAQQKEQQVQTMRNALSQIETQERGPADAFADAMRRGDFDAAQQALQEMTEQLDQLPEDQRQALGQQLDDMSQQLQQMADQQGQQQQQMQQQMQQALQQQGVSQQQAQQLQQQGMNQQAVQQALQQQGMSQQQAQQMAQQMQQMQQQAQNQGQSSQQMQQLSQAMKQMGQASQNPQGGQQGQQGGQQQAQRSSQQMQQALSQMSQMQQQLQQMQQSQGQLQQAMQQMGQGQGGQGQGQGQSQQGGQNQSLAQRNGQGGGVGGQKAGTGEGGPVQGQERRLSGYNTRNESDINQPGQGRVIASWFTNDENLKGEAQVEYDQAVTEARDQAEHAMDQEDVPRRYHNAIRDYFNQMPEAQPGQPTGEPRRRAPR